MTIKPAKESDMSDKKYRVWHIPQVPGKPFEVEADSLEEAIKIRDILAYYDLFQLRHNIKPDFTNASGIEEEEPEYPGEWFEVDDLEDDPEGGLPEWMVTTDLWGH